MKWFLFEYRWVLFLISKIYEMYDVSARRDDCVTTWFTYPVLSIWFTEKNRRYEILMAPALKFVYFFLYIFIGHEMDALDGTQTIWDTMCGGTMSKSCHAFDAYLSSVLRSATPCVFSRRDLFDCYHMFYVRCLNKIKKQTRKTTRESEKIKWAETNRKIY